MYPAHTQLVAKWSSPSIGDQRATGWLLDGAFAVVDIGDAESSSLTTRFSH